MPFRYVYFRGKGTSLKSEGGGPSQVDVDVDPRVEEGGQEERHARVVRGHPRGDGHVPAGARAARAAAPAPAPHDLQLRPG